MISTKNVMIISSDALFNTKLSRVLKQPEYKTHYAHREDINLQSKIHRINPDLIIIDPEIPSLKGLGLSLLVRQWSPVPILMLSGERTPDNEIRMLDMRSDEYLSESFNVRLVPVRINSLLSASPAI